MDFKREIEIKDESLECIDDDAIDTHCQDQVLQLKDIQERNSFTYVDVKLEFGVKDEPLDNTEVKDDPLGTEAEDTVNSELLEQSSKINENQTLISDPGEEGSSSKGKKTTSRRPQSPATHHLSIKKENFQTLSCIYCHLNFECEEELKSHQKFHKKKFQCEHCNFESNSKSHLKTHVLIHSDIKLFKCSDCSYECNRKFHLARHMLKHGDKKLFKCSDCDYGCNDRRNLKVHILNHSDVKLFKCSECSYEYNDKRNFRHHMLIHSNIKLLKCSECDYESNHNGNFKRHLLKHRNFEGTRENVLRNSSDDIERN